MSKKDTITVYCSKCGEKIATLLYPHTCFNEESMESIELVCEKCKKSAKEQFNSWTGEPIEKEEEEN